MRRDGLARKIRDPTRQGFWAQGTGKTRTLDQLSHVFPDSIYFKWSADWLKRLLQWQDAHDNYLGFLEGEAEELFEELGRKGKQPSWMKRAHINLGRPSRIEA